MSGMKIGGKVTCGKCGGVVTSDNLSLHLSLHDDCLPNELREGRLARVTAESDILVLLRNHAKTIDLAIAEIERLRAEIGRLNDATGWIKTAITKATGRED